MQINFRYLTGFVRCGSDPGTPSIMAWFCLLLMLAVSSQAWAQQQTADQQLETFLNGLVSMKAEFQQTLELPDNGGLYVSYGHFYLKRPGRLRWEYDSPNPQLIVADGNRIWLHDYELEQVSHRSQADALKGTPAQLLSESGSYHQYFESKALVTDDGFDWLELTPKQADSQFSRLKLAMDSGSLHRIEMLDNFGQTTYFILTNVERNAALDDDLFDYQPPSGIDLISDL